MTISADDLETIRGDLAYRIDRMWHAILREASEKMAGRPAGASRSILFEFEDMKQSTIAAIDETWVYILNVCKVRATRPPDLVPIGIEGLRAFTDGMHAYASRRSVGAAAFGESKLVDDFSANAMAGIQKHLDVSAREAAVGYAGNKAVFPQSEWPKTGRQRLSAGTQGAGLFVLGTAVGAGIKEFLARLL